jgi:restriction system protein
MEGESEPAIWVVRAGRGSTFAADFEGLGVVGIGFGVQTSVEAHSPEQIRELVRSASETDAPQTIAGHAGQLNRFANELRAGDVVITPDSGTRELLFGEAVGGYEFHQKPLVGDFCHYRRVRWIGRRSRDLLPQRVLYSLGSLSTVFQPGGREQLMALMHEEPVPDRVSSDDGGTDAVDAGGENLLADLQARSEELISARIAQLDAYETQDLVAGVLRAMGFHARVSPPGTDQGVDIVASRDPLGLEQPVKVQVKARPNSRTGAPEVSQLAGNIGSGERGMFVSTGGFTREVSIHPSAQRLVLVDGEALRDLVLEYYDRLDNDAQALVPLRRVYFPTD